MSIFHPTFLVLVAGVSNAFLAGDLFNLYVGFEILLMASYVLLTLGGTAPRIRGGHHLRRRQPDQLADLPGRDRADLRRDRHREHGAARRSGSASCPPAPSCCCSSLLLIAFCIKAAVFPLSAWLPDSYPTAPAPVTAVFAGLLTKVGVYAIIRTQTLLFPDGGARRPAAVGRPGHDGDRHPGRGRADRHPPHAVLHPGQPHRLHGLRHRPGDDGRAGRRDLLRRPPHRHPDDAVPGRRADRAPGRVDVGRPARRPGRQRAAAGGAVLRARR